MSGLFPISPERYELVLRCLELELEIERLRKLLAHTEAQQQRLRRNMADTRHWRPSRYSRVVS